MAKQIKYLDLNGLQTYHENLSQKLEELYSKLNEVIAVINEITDANLNQI